jgi:hypothetical protein
MFIAGTRTNFQVKACDAFANQLTQGGDDVSASLTLVPLGYNVTQALFGAGMMLSVVDQNDGSYSIDYIHTRAGHYSLMVGVKAQPEGLHVSVTGNAAQASSPSTSGITLSAAGVPYAPAISVGTAGIDGTFTLQSRDQFGNSISVGGEVFTIEVAGPDLGLTFITDLKNGTYLATYKVLQKGRYQLSVRLNGIHVGVLWSAQLENSTIVFGSPFKLLGAFGI